MRSMPMPQPPVGGRPYSSAVQKASSTYIASSSPALFACSQQRPDQPLLFAKCHFTANQGMVQRAHMLLSWTAF